MLIATFTYMYTWVYTGEVGAKRLRERYLQATLRQDIAYFDNVGAGEVATRIQTDTRKFFLLSNLLFSNRTVDLVQQGTSEKVALVTFFIASFIAAFGMGCARSWRLALALTAMLPCIAIAGGVMTKFVTQYAR